MGSLSEPTVMAVRSSMYSTGLIDDGGLQPESRPMAKTAAIAGRRIARSIPGREPEPIIELRIPGILLAMVKRFRRFYATSLWIWLVIATGALRTAHAC